MKVLGITGGVGAGKSTVLMYLKEHYGARVIQADQVGHLLQQPACELLSQDRRTVRNDGFKCRWDDQPSEAWRDRLYRSAENGAVECNYASIYPTMDQVGGRGRTKTGVCAIRDRRSGTSPGRSL